MSGETQNFNSITRDGNVRKMTLIEYVGILTAFMLVLHLVGKLVQNTHENFRYPGRGVRNGKKHTPPKRVVN